MKLGQLVTDPPVAVCAGPGPWDCLTEGSVELPHGHPALAAAGRVSRAGVQPCRTSLTPRVDLLNLGRDAGDPGLLFLLAPGGGSGGRDLRGTWVVWGVPRPSVNLFLGSALKGFSSLAGQTPDRDAALRIIGSNTFRDIDMEMDVRVRHVLRPLVYRVYPDAPLREVQDLMLRRGLAAIPVVGKDHEMLGVVEAGDVLSHIVPGNEGSAERRSPMARDIMKRTVLCVSEDESLIEASRSMIARHVPRLPVVREGRLVGFLDRGAVLRAFADTVVTPAERRPPG